ncbi:MAG: trimethylamine methyltransferase family protein [Clostridiales Family XIII bacterium]|jgi:trimethylamine--corrinoid protein Co-methyltransferase|nr:trimethylamine methyltransferase family protein [Clostridiales Family XIII bacterium]
MKPELRVLSDDERQTIHEEAIRILEEVGVKFPAERALDLLEEKGADVDRAAMTAKISARMVGEALASCPKEVFFGARDRAWDFTLPSASSLYNLDGCGVFTYDYASGARRASVLQDVADAAKIFDRFDLGYLAWPPVSPEDVPIGPRSIISTATVMKNTSKHVMDEVKTPEEVPYMVEISAALAGGHDKLKERNMYSVTYCTVSPLTHDGSMMTATMDLSRYHAPILVYPTPATGTTGPVSLYYNVVMAVAEALSSIVLFQACSPGCPLVMGAAMGAVDGRTGAFFYAMPETVLMLEAVREMCDYYNMPSFIAGATADAKNPGIQAAIEKVLTSLPLVLSGTGMLNGIGLLECGMTLSFEQMVIDGEIALLNHRMKAGIDISPEKNLFEDVKAIGPGGHFLKRKSTRTLFRTEEFYQTDFLDRGSYEDWAAAGGKDLLARAHDRVLAILKEDSRVPMDSGLAKVIREIVEEAAAKLV